MLLALASTAGTEDEHWVSYRAAARLPLVKSGWRVCAVRTALINLLAGWSRGAGSVRFGTIPGPDLEAPPVGRRHDGRSPSHAWFVVFNAPSYSP